MFHVSMETPFEQLPCIFNGANGSIMSQLFNIGMCQASYSNTPFHIFTVQDLLLFCNFTAWNYPSLFQA